MASPIALTPATTPPPVPVSVGGGSGGGSGAAGFAAVLDHSVNGTPVMGGRPVALSLSSRSEAETRAAIHKTAGDFEAACLGQLMGFMNQDIAVDPNFGGGHGEEMYRDMMNAEYGKLARHGGGLGVGVQVERDLLRAQGLKPLKHLSLEV